MTLDIIIIFLILLILFMCINMFFKRNIEKYGVYCGKYKEQSSCSNDSECTWNPYTSVSGDVSGWCGVNNNLSS